MSKKKISIVTPCLNEVKTIEECTNQIKKFFSSRPKYDYEHIIVDNFSTDGSREIIENLASSDSNIKAIFNSKTFDPFKSLFNGIGYATGDAVVLCFVSDLEDPVEVIGDYLKFWEQGFKVVYGKRILRTDESKLKIFFREIFYFFQKKLDISYEKNVNEFMLVDKQVHQELVKIDDYSPYVRGLVNYLGFKSKSVEYEPNYRKFGNSNFSWFSHIPHALNAFISFSNLPRMLIFLGFIISSTSIFYSVYIFLSVIIFDINLSQGLTTILVAMFFLLGFIIFSLGILGEYLIAIHNQVRKKPMVVEEKKINL